MSDHKYGIEVRDKLIHELLLYIEKLEAALREISENSRGWSANQLSYVAHGALEGE